MVLCLPCDYLGVSVVVCDAEEDAQAETFEITEEMLRELQEQGIDISKINFATPGSGEEGGKKVMPPPRRPVPEIRTAISFQNNPQGKGMERLQPCVLFYQTLLLVKKPVLWLVYETWVTPHWTSPGLLPLSAILITSNILFKTFVVL